MPLSISDTDVSINLQRVAVSNPLPPLSPDRNTLDLLVEQQSAILAHIVTLETRVRELEARTWWSMLVSWVKSAFRRV